MRGPAYHPPELALSQTFRRFRRRRARDPVAVGAPSLTDEDWPLVRERIESVLVANDTTTQREAVAVLADAYEALDDEGRHRFLVAIASEFGVDTAAVRTAAQAIADDPRDQHRHVELRRSLTPRYAPLLHLLTGLDGGVKFLVDLRADLRRLARDEVPLLHHELTGHLTTLFDVGLLELRRITWDSPASLLEKLIEYEAVHEIDGWDDLRDRLDLDRRCFAFLHPAMPGEPVVFVEIALVTGPPTSLADLLDRTTPPCDPASADTAVFYSITSCQTGLAGINLGNALLKEVVGKLCRELPNLRAFVTLSPIPSLRDADLGLDDEAIAALADDHWLEDPEAEAVARRALLPVAARYLTTAVDGRVVDPVANFHLSNGASVDAVRWRANTEDYGLRRSWGIMASYRYDPDTIARNAEAYASGTLVPTSEAVERLAAEPPDQRTQGGASSGSMS